jgi:phage terminase large subunit-like protein
MIAVPPLAARYLTWGPVVAEWAERRMGLACTPWQRFALDRLLEVDPDRGRLRYRSAIVSCARRNGKSTVLRGPLGWLLDTSPLWSLGAITAPTREQAYAALFA